MNKSLIANVIKKLIDRDEIELSEELLDNCCSCDMSWAGSWEPSDAESEALLWKQIYDSHGWDYPKDLTDWL